MNMPVPWHRGLGTCLVLCTLAPLASSLGLPVAIAAVLIVIILTPSLSRDAIPRLSFFLGTSLARASLRLCVGGPWSIMPDIRKRPWLSTGSSFSLPPPVTLILLLSLAQAQSLLLLFGSHDAQTILHHGAHAQ